MSNDLRQVAQHLADVLTQENAALQRMDFAAVKGFIAVKEAALSKLTQHPAIAAMPPALTALGQKIGHLAEENRVLLERAIAVQTRVVRIVARACAPPPPPPHYGGPPPRSPSNRATALALSTRA